MHLKRGIFELLNALQQDGFELVLITNQSGIGRGYYTKEDFLALNSFMLEQFKAQGIHFLATKFCPHTPQDGCYCRKPKSGMIDDIIAQYRVDIAQCWLIGDKDSDIAAGENAGITNTILISEDGHSYKGCYGVRGLDQILDIIRSTL